MAIDRFSRDQFEQQLELICASTGFQGVNKLGLVSGEYVYDLVVDSKVSVRIRSSIDVSGLASPTAKNSIRLWLVHHITGTQISKLDRDWINRTAGWKDRLFTEVCVLLDYRKVSGDCPKCNHPMFVYRAKSQDNMGRLFTSCFKCHVFHWLEEAPYSGLQPRFTVYFEPEMQLTSPTGEEPDGKSPCPSDDAELPGPDSAEDGLTVGWSPTSTPEGSSPDGEVDSLDLLEEEEEEEIPVSTYIERQPNEEQAMAIYAPLEGSYRVLAPPGSGKTFLLVRRVRHLLQSGVSMGNILTVTFTSKMADELLYKLTELMPELKDNQFASRNVSTIHAACYRMLKDYGDPRRYMDSDKWKLKAFLQEQATANWHNETERPTWKELLDWTYTAKSAGIDRDKWFNFFDGIFPYYAFKVTQIAHALDTYMRSNKWLLFGDMLYEVEMLLKNDPVFTRRYQTLYKYILVDEGQDTSGQAMRILTTLAAPQDNFFIVGDADQLLYRFAGATPELNLYDGFEKRFPDGQLIKLVRNYRSTPTIVGTCNQLIGFNYAVRGGPYDDKYRKEVQAFQPDDNAVVEFSSFATPEREAFAVSTGIQSLIVDGYTPGDVFVGARTRAQLTYLEPWLMKLDIPFINIAGSSFWGSRHVQDMLAFLKVAVNSYDEAAFARIYNIASNNFVHPWGDQKGEYCSHHYLPRVFLNDVPNLRKCSLDSRSFRFPHKYSWKPGMQDITELMTEVIAALENGGIGDALRVIADGCYLKYLQFELGLEIEADGGPLDDINTFIEFSTDFTSPSDFIEYVEAAKVQADKAAEKSMEAWKGSVVLSTIHRLKGLERKVVFGLGFAEGYKPAPYDTKIPSGLLPHTFSLVEPPNMGVLPGSGKGRVEDERCCAFVLVSRAMERVYLSAPETYQGAVLDPSRFVEELGFSVR